MAYAAVFTFAPARDCHTITLLKVANMENDVSIPAGVGWTSLITAYARAQETRRPDRLFEDRYAGTYIAALIGGDNSEGEMLPPVGPAHDDGSSTLWTMFNAYFAGRTPFYDDQVRQGVEHGARQVCLLAAGLDSRAERLKAETAIRYFELDTSAVLHFKACHQPTPATAVCTNLLDDWASALCDAGFQPSLPTVWLAEGLLMYFDADECDRLLAQVSHLSAPGSRIALEYFDRSPRPGEISLGDPKDDKTAEQIASMFRGGPLDPPESWLARFGWTDAVVVSDIAAELVRHGRPVPQLFDPGRPEPVTVWLAAGTR